MHFTIQREALLKPLQLVAGVVERRQTLPVLSNVLLVVEGQQLSLTGTDLEVELVGRVQLEELLPFRSCLYFRSRDVPRGYLNWQ